MGGGKGGLPLTSFPGRETTSDTLLLADAVSDAPYRICFDLGTGTGSVFRNASSTAGFRVGIDFSMEALSCFDPVYGQPVLCPVEQISRTFRRNCADLVVANPPYYQIGQNRRSPDLKRDQARAGDSLTLFRFIFAGAFLLKPGGMIIVSTREEDTGRVQTGLRAAGFVSLGIMRGRGVFAVRGLLGESLHPEDCSGIKSCI